MEGTNQTVDKVYTPQPALSFKEAISTCFKKYFDFSGRARGSEYWYFILFITLISFPIAILDAVFFGSDSIAPIGLIFSLGTIVPSIAVAARRLHDSGKSGWWQLLYVTIIGIFVVLYWLIRKGDDRENEYAQK
jgi:uncharacterized membrane protein YhaH (DUF805 family)